MGLKTFFHKIKMTFVRLGETPIPNVSPEKRYGNNGEYSFIHKMREALPAAKIKQNVIINTAGGNAEIDCLILYANKLFAIEIKRWKGKLVETESGFIQEKTDRWTGKLHTKPQKSPFKQLNRAIYLLRNQIPGKVWINGVVFFEDDEFEGIELSSETDKIWFDDLRQLTDYICNCEKTSLTLDAERFFEKCVSADRLYAKAWDKSMNCIIDDSSLHFETTEGIINRENIRHIKINHHLSYDELNITLMSGDTRKITQENAKIKVGDNGVTREFALCKLDYIELGI